VLTQTLNNISSLHLPEQTRLRASIVTLQNNGRRTCRGTVLANIARAACFWLLGNAACAILIMPSSGIALSGISMALITDAAASAGAVLVARRHAGRTSQRRAIWLSVTGVRRLARRGAGIALSLVANSRRAA